MCVCRLKQSVIPAFLLVLHPEGQVSLPGVSIKSAEGVPTSTAAQARHRAQPRGQDKPDGAAGYSIGDLAHLCNPNLKAVRQRLISVKRGLEQTGLIAMKCIRLPAILGLTAIFVGGCAVQKFRSAPVTPAHMASVIQARTLDDPGLRSFSEQSLGRSITWPPKAWDLRLLTLAAFYFNPQLETARDRVAAAQAAIITAGMRPNPTLSISPGIPSPYLLGLDFAIPVVTAGKRKYQIEAAKNLSEAARLTLAQTAWTVRTSVRSALLNVLVAERSQNLWRAEEKLQSERVTRLAKRLETGEIARPIVDSAQVDLLNSELATRAAEGRVTQARAVLAAAIGIPVAGLQNARFNWPQFDQLPLPSSLSAVQIQRAAVLNRLDVRQALAQYSAAEAALQLEIARQKPDFNIGPGYQFEEGHNFFAPTLSVTLPLFNRNQGPIAEAEARRRQAADSLLATQTRVIAESDQALAGYRAAYSQLRDAQLALASLRHVQEPMSMQQVAIGEVDWMSLNTVLLQGSAAAQAWLNAVFQGQAALGALEGAIQKPLEPEDDTPVVLRAPDSSNRTQ